MLRTYIKYSTIQFCTYSFFTSFPILPKSIFHQKYLWSLLKISDILFFRFFAKFQRFFHIILYFFFMWWYSLIKNLHYPIKKTLRNVETTPKSYTITFFLTFFLTFFCTFFLTQNSKNIQKIIMRNPLGLLSLIWIFIC